MARKKVDIKDKKLFLNFVYLSDAEHADLCERLGKEATDKWIEELNGGIGQHGYKYESHYWTIRNWARRAGAKKTTVTSDARLVAWMGVLELLKHPTAGMPTQPEPLRQALYNLLLARKMNWFQLKTLLASRPELEPEIRKEFLEALSASRGVTDDPVGDINRMKEKLENHDGTEEYNKKHFGW